MTEALLQTKVYIPPLRPNLVRRPHLIEQLNQGLRLGRKLTLISAPAGFGKTTLLAEWAMRNTESTSPHSALHIPNSELQTPHFCWLSLDEGDNDPVRFLAYLIAALQSVADLNQAAGSKTTIGKGALDILQSPQPPAAAVLTALINDITTIPGSIILTLDDYHVIESPPIDASSSVDASTDVDGVLSFLIEHLPQNLHLVIATRDDPQLPLARLRARGQLTELRALDLRFSYAEVAEFLNQVMALDLSAEDIAALEDRTEGWIAGLQLAAISMQGQETAASLIKSFTGSHRYVLDYLIEEVLDQQPQSIQDFLLQTAILSRMNGSLCDAVRFPETPNSSKGTTTTNQENGQAILEMLERANLFIVPLDEKRYWYRYHHLFSDLLRQRLQQQQPGSAPRLQLRASKWYEKHGHSDEAIDYALRAGNFERATRLIDNEARAVWQRGTHTKLRRWVDRLPTEWTCVKPRLCIISAEDMLLSGRQDAAEQTLQEAESVISQDGDQTAEPAPKPYADSEKIQLLGSIEVTRAFLAFYRGDVQAIIQHSRQALEYLPDQVSAWRSSAIGAMGDAHTFRGDMAAAQQAQSEALAASKAAGNIYMALITGTKLAITIRNRGRLKQTIESCRQQLQFAGENGLSGSAVAGWLLAVWGEALAEINDLDEALQQTEQGVELTTRRGHSEDVAMFGWSNLCLIRVLFSRGDLAAAEEIIRELEAFDRGSDVPPWITSMTAAWQARLWLAQERLDEAIRWAQGRGISSSANSMPAAGPDFFLLFDYIMLARILIAQGRLDEAAGLLERLLKTAEAGNQAARAIEITLLQALAYQAGGDKDRAINAIEQALTLAEPEGFTRIFVDEGEPMARLMQQAITRGIAPSYAHQLLAAFSDVKPQQTVPSKTHSEIRKSKFEIVEPLSERELEILHLIAEGLTNQQIASRLYLSLNTVKSHTRNIYGKLDVHSRIQAVTRARSSGMLPPN